jgi:hypothetical protein
MTSYANVDVCIGGSTGNIAVASSATAGSDAPNERLITCEMVRFPELSPNSVGSEPLALGSHGHIPYQANASNMSWAVTCVLPSGSVFRGLHALQKSSELYGLLARLLAVFTTKSQPSHALNARQLPTRESLRHMARVEPRRLIEMINRGELPPPELSHAAEILGTVGSADARISLERLLDHSSALVREGAIYGLAQGCLDPRARRALERLAATDQSTAVREAALGALDE